MISLEIQLPFLTLDDFPGDPNAGHQVSPGKLTLACNTNHEPGSSYCETNLLPHYTSVVFTTNRFSNGPMFLPPTPDLSMPFNVISLTSSILAYIVGALITILVRKGSSKIKHTLHEPKRAKQHGTFSFPFLRHHKNLGNSERSL